MTSKKRDEKRQAQIDAIKKGMKQAEQWHERRRWLMWIGGGVAAVAIVGAVAIYYSRPVPITDDDFITVQDEL